MQRYFSNHNSRKPKSGNQRRVPGASPRSSSGSSKFHEFDRGLLVAFILLLVFGLVMLFSASSVVSYAKFGNTYHYLLSQILGLSLGFLAFLVVVRIDYHHWKRFSAFFLVGSILLLIAVFVPGLRSNYGTAHSWIVIFGHSIQTSEFVKIFFLLYLAAWLETKQDDLDSFKDVVVPFVLNLAIVGLLMIAQPNLGTLFIIVAIAMTVFFIGNGRIWHMAFMVIAGVLAVFVLMQFHHSYQTDRFKCLKNLNYSPQDKCYQVSQSLIAVGSGGFMGRGLGKSREKFLYLPEVWADSIFPIIAEETGFIFSSLLILLYLFIFYRGLLIARRAPDLYGSMIASGIVVWFATETFLNIGGMMNIIPMTGVPLPFISAGGSAAVASLISLGILLNISKQTQ